MKPGDELDNGKYRLIRELGRGGMGVVFEAEHTVSGKRFAIKCLHPDRSRAAHAMERMIREAQAAARVDHPHAVEVYDVGQSGGTMFLVMEYLKGETLDVALTRRSLEPHETIALLLDGMRAVACAHRKGVIHRDIKPANIFLAKEEDNPERQTKVLDFGISKILQDHEEPSLTVARAVLGSPAYMSYEQLDGQPDVDARTDVYAFGVVLYEALTGQLPYPPFSVHALISHMLQGPPASPKELRSDLPTPLSNLVLWTLEREREERIASLDELILELAPYATRRGFEADRSTESAPSVDDASRPPRVPAPRNRSSFELGRTELDAARAPAAPKAPRKRAVARWGWSIAAIGAITTVALVAASMKPQQPLAAPRLGPVPPVVDVSTPVKTDAWRTSVLATPVATTPSIAVRELPAVTPEAPVDTPPAPAPAEPPPPAARTRLRVPAPRAKELAALREVRDARAQAVEQTRRKLVECGDLTTEWVRENCKERTKRELAQRQEDYELADSLLRRKP